MLFGYSMMPPVKICCGHKNGPNREVWGIPVPNLSCKVYDGKG